MPRKLFALCATLLLAMACDTSAPTDIVNPPPVAIPVTAVQVNNPYATLHPGQTLPLTATPKGAAGQPLDRPVTWASLNPALATVSATGSVTALAVGTVRINATSEGVTGFVDVVITQVPVLTVTISPPSAQLHEGGTLALQAVARDASGTPLEGRPLTWTSDNPAVATVSNTGVVTGVQEGFANIKVEVENAVMQALIQVQPRPVARVVMELESTDLEVGDEVHAALRTEAANGAILTGRLIMTGTDKPWVADIVGGRVRALGSGTVVISAHSEGVTTQLTVTVHPRPALGLIFHRLVGTGTEIFVREPYGAVNRINAGNVSRNAFPSPDGRRVVFAVTQVNPTNGEMMHDLFVVNRDGLNMRHLTQMAGVEDEPVWSPDGTRIAFAGSETVGGMRDIYVMNADGTGVVNVTGDMPWSHETTPAWSPSSAELAFTSMDILGNTSIYTVNANGTARRRVATSATGAVRNPSWSPDGTRIAFSRVFPHMGMDIVIMPRNGGAETRLQRPSDQVDIQWSPDGQHFAFAEASNTNWYIGTMRVDGSAARLLTPGGRPAWIRP